MTGNTPETTERPHIIIDGTVENPTGDHQHNRSGSHSRVHTREIRPSERGLAPNAKNTSDGTPKTERRQSMKHEVKTNRPDGQGRVTIESYTRGKAIRIHCTECMGYESDPKDCTAKNCALFPYRKKTHMAYEKEAPKNASTSTLAAPEAR